VGVERHPSSCSLALQSNSRAILSFQTRTSLCQGWAKTTAEQRHTSMRLGSGSGKKRQYARQPSGPSPVLEPTRAGVRFRPAASRAADYACGVEVQIDWHEAYADLYRERIKLQVFSTRSIARPTRNPDLRGSSVHGHHSACTCSVTNLHPESLRETPCA
jgi:hypothetical protein